MLNSSIWAIDKSLACATTPGRFGFGSGLGSDGNEELLYIPKMSKVGSSPSVSSPEKSFVVSYPTAISFISDFDKQDYVPP